MASGDRVMKKLFGLALDPYRQRNLLLAAVQKRSVGSYEWRVEIGAVERPAYAYCVREAGRLAKRLGIPRVSVVEFGVAGGNGLLALEEHARRWSDLLGVDIEVYGFDTGTGLPTLSDYRDLPYHWQGGSFDMDADALRRRLKSAKLVLGNVDETLNSFVDEYDPAPIGAVMFDMDLYSSTVSGLRLFDVDEKSRLPRIFTYFDDIIGYEVSLFSDYTGERLAMAEFNESHASQKISPAYHLSTRALAKWHHQIYIVHDFAHSRYVDFVGRTSAQLPLQDG
jgi:hypothetical protein